jgi:quinohemoprotein ethanol dehydrogenase
MRIQLPRSTHFSFLMSMWKCVIALLCCAFSIEPLFAQTLNWSYYGNDISNSRFQDIDQINPSNVAELTPAWTFHTGIYDPNMIMEMTPIVVNGVMYVTTGDDDVFALNAVTGKEIWAYHPTDMAKISTLAVCCGNDNRGVAIGGGLVFNARLDANLVALSAATGKVVWTTAVDSPSNGASMTLAPLYISAGDGTVPEVIVGISGGDEGARGHLDAYNPATGKLLWRFWTTDPATWAGTSWQHGGAPIWGGNRAGTNLYASSVVALDATSGELQWYFQETHHDIWDFDGPQPTVLFTWNGIPALEHTSKTGYMFVLDRASGESLMPYQEVAVPPASANAAFQKPWPTQPVSSIESLIEHQATNLPAGYIAAPMWTPVGPTPMVLQPFEGGGMEWPPAAYSPRTNFIYSHAKYLAIDAAVLDNTASQEAAATGDYFKLDAVGGFQFLGVPGAVSHGVYGAVNPVTGTVAWTIPIVTSVPNSGVTVAGDLVFFGDSTGLFYAASAATGEILWIFDAAIDADTGGANASPAVYEVDGVEYVVYGFGGNPDISTTLGDAVIAFALPSATAAAKKRDNPVITRRP